MEGRRLRKSDMTSMRMRKQKGRLSPADVSNHSRVRHAAHMRECRMRWDEIDRNGPGSFALRAFADSLQWDWRFTQRRHSSPSLLLLLLRMPLLLWGGVDLFTRLLTHAYGIYHSIRNAMRCNATRCSCTTRLMLWFLSLCM